MSDDERCSRCGQRWIAEEECNRLHDEADYWQQKIDELNVENERLRSVLRFIAAPTYGTEGWMNDEERADVYWSHLSTFQYKARKILKGNDDKK